MQLNQFTAIAHNKGKMTQMLDIRVARQWWHNLSKVQRYNQIPYKTQAFRLTNGRLRWTFSPKSNGKVHVLAMTIV